MSLDVDKVYETARSLLPAAISFSIKKGLDPTLAEDLLMEAAENLLNRKSTGDTDIKNIPGYLFTSFKNLVLNELQQNQRYEDLTEAQFGSLSDRQIAVSQIEKEILKEQIVRHLSPEARFIFNCLVLGYSFKEISSLFYQQFGLRMADNAIRSKYSKALQRTAKKLRETNPSTKLEHDPDLTP